MQSIGHMLLVLWIAVSNLAIGFALAMAMGHGPRRLTSRGFAMLPKFKLPAIPKLTLRTLRCRTKVIEDEEVANDKAEPTAQVVGQPSIEPTSTTVDDGMLRDEASSTSNTSTENAQNAEPEHLEQMNASEALDEWWADDPKHQRPLTMGMVDIDAVGRLNETRGRDATDEILARIEALILADDLDGGRASQINPQRFLLLLPNLSHEQCTRSVESLREAIEHMDIGDEPGELRVTASCAVAIAKTGDTARGLVSRAEAALVEAKQIGGNRTFLNEGEFSTPVVTAELAAPAGVG